jgi:hypothetical protein
MYRSEKEFTGVGLPRLMTCGFDADVALTTNIIIGKKNKV